MRKKVFAEPQKLDQQNAEKQWLELIKMLEENYLIKSNRKGEIFLNIFDETDYSMEIDLNGVESPSNYIVRLWHGGSLSVSAPLDTLLGIVEVIDDFHDRVKYAKNKR